MKYGEINPQYIIIQENLENYNNINFSIYKDYLASNVNKKVITILYKNYLIAIDGNKFCAVSRLLKKKVNVVILENKDDFEDFFVSHDKNIYDSILIDYDKSVEFKKNLEFFEKTLNYNIAEKDYFSKENKRERFVENSSYIKENLEFKYRDNCEKDIIK